MKRCILKKIMMMTLTIIMVLSNGQNISAIEVNKLDTEVSNQNDRFGLLLSVCRDCIGDVNIRNGEEE